MALGLTAQTTAQSQPANPLPDYVTAQFGTPPDIPDGPLSPALQAAVQTAFIDSVTQQTWGEAQQDALSQIAQSGDPRLAWLISDMLRFVSSQGLQQSFTQAASTLINQPLSAGAAWGKLTDHLMAWDMPAPPGYLTAKAAIFTNIVPGWDRIFVEGDIDWRLVSWGGVLIDDRAFDTTDELCNCIPAVDNPDVIPAAQATWLAEDDIVFGIVVNGEARAYPRQIMEVREMVNDTLGGRDLGIPYCTLCGAAQAYFTDAVPAGVQRPVLRTSGLLIRSNKVMYDVNTFSVFDTFLGRAVTGPLAGLPVHEDVIGVITASGQPVAFQRSTALAALLRGEEITVENVRLEVDAGGIKAVDKTGSDLGSHQAFWFAWSQFHPETELWGG